MKRILKICLCLMMAVGVVGCGGSASTEKQEAVVKQFFDYFKEGDVDKLATVCTKDNKDIGQMTSMLSSLDAYRKPETYGQKFVDEADLFIKEVFSTMIVSYEIKETKKDGDDYTVTVEATLKDYQNLKFSNTEMNSIIKEYQNEHLTELQELYKSKGKQVMQEKIFGDIAEKLFASMKAQLKDVKDIKHKMVFTLTADGDNWLISKMAEYEAN